MVCVLCIISFLNRIQNFLQAPLKSFQTLHVVTQQLITVLLYCVWDIIFIHVKLLNQITRKGTSFYVYQHVNDIIITTSVKGNIRKQCRKVVINEILIGKLMQVEFIDFWPCICTGSMYAVKSFIKHFICVTNYAYTKRLFQYLLHVNILERKQKRAFKTKPFFKNFS